MFDARGDPAFPFPSQLPRLYVDFSGREHTSPLCPACAPGGTVWAFDVGRDPAARCEACREPEAVDAALRAILERDEDAKTWYDELRAEACE